MNLKRILVFIVILLVAVTVTACVRSASKAPTGEVEATSAGSFPLPGATNDVMGELEQAATQTLMAQTAGQATPTPLPVETQPTAEAAAVQATPTAQIQLPAVSQSQPATAVPQAFPTPTPGIPTSYTLQTGEHPYCIARRFNINPEELLRQSGLSAGSTYYAGMALKIPQTGNTFPSARALKSHPTTYTVSSGDTIFTIACDFGDVDPYQIAAVNGISSPYKLTSGQTLQIP